MACASSFLEQKGSFDVNSIPIRERVHLPSSVVKLNFYKACRVFFDNAAKALRLAILNERKDHQDSLPPGDLSELDFSHLADHLVTPKQTISDKRVCGSFYSKWFTGKPEKGTEPNTCLIVSNGIKLGDFAKEEKVCVNGILSPMEVCDGTSLKLKRSLDEKKEKGRKCCVYLLSGKCKALINLKELRNACVGHPNSMSVTDDKLEEIYSVAEKTYRKLGVYRDNICEELEEIKKEVITDEKCLNEKIYSFRKEIEQVWKELEALGERISRIEDSFHKGAAVVNKLFHKVDDMDDKFDYMDDRIKQLEKQKSGPGPAKTFPNIIVVPSTVSGTTTLMLPGGLHVSDTGSSFAALTGSRQLALQSSRESNSNTQAPKPKLLPGQPIPGEIERLSEKISRHFEDCDKMWKDFCIVLGLDKITASSEIKENQPLKDQIRVLLNIWVETSSKNDRCSLKQCLVKNKLSFCVKCLETE